MVRHKVAQVVQHFALAPDSHDGKALQHILESFPRDELFQASVPELNKVVTGIFGLQERPRVRLLLRRDPFRRFYTCLVFVPREKYNTQVRQRIERVVSEGFNAFSMESQVQIAESNLARIHLVARTLPVETERIGADELELRVAAAVRSWTDAFKSALLARFDEAYALSLFDAYARRFPRLIRGLCGGCRRARRVVPRGRREGACPAAPRHLSPGAAAPRPVLSQDLPRQGRHSNLRPSADAGEHGPEGDRGAAV